MIHKGMKL